MRLWPAGAARPERAVSGSLSGGVYSVTTPLKRGAVYWWQVGSGRGNVQCNSPIWSFTTRP